MGRHLPMEKPPADMDLKPRPVIADLVLAVVTPMFGGGAETGHSDDDFPIRPSAIRGHLRFWWRACNARAYADLGELFSKEAELWGAMPSGPNDPPGPSAIEIEIERIEDGAKSFFFHPEKVDSQGKNIPFNRRGWYQGRSLDPKGQRPRGPAYALFPFTGMGDTTRQEGREGVVFRLRIVPAAHVPKSEMTSLRDAVDGALWSWITFGGVGARTRRGCGTLYCVGDAVTSDAEQPTLRAALYQPDSNDTRRWIQREHTKRIHGRAHASFVPSLVDAKVLVDPVPAGLIETWSDVVHLMWEFRQGPDVARNPTGSKPFVPGESYWPEPGAVRQQLGFSGHFVLSTSSGDDFPRADLGLPIGFGQIWQGDTPELSFAKDGAARMASPIILKALPLDDSQAIPLVLVLNAPHVWEFPPDVAGQHLKLEGNHRTRRLGAAGLNRTNHRWRYSRWRTGNGTGGASRPEPAPMGTTKASARDAFCDFVAAGWGQPWTVLS